MALKAVLKAFFFFIFCSFFAVYSVSLRATSSQFSMQDLDPSPPPLPSLNIDPKRVSLSGLFFGGFMDVQLHIAFSSYFKGIGVFAGGPYYCAEGKFDKALDQCMHPKDEIFLPDSQKLIDWTKKLAAENKVDDLDHLKMAKVC